MPRKRRSAITVPLGDFRLEKIGASRFDFRDPYHLAVSLSWPAFVLALLGLWLALNIAFATLYLQDPNGVANARPGSFGDAFFFSIETLATVGYGVMAPSSLYCHIISASEIVTGTAFTAIVTGLLFVRFSRPKARIIFAADAVVTPHNNQPTLMLRLVNGRMTTMTGANARLSVLIAETTKEGRAFRRIQDLQLVQSHLPMFVLPWTLMHRIDDSSPLAGLSADAMAANDVRLILSVEARDRALATVVHDLKVYDAAHIRFGMRFADTVSLDAAGMATADLTRIGLLEPDGGATAQQ